MKHHQHAHCDGSALPSVLAVLMLCGLGAMLSWQSIWRNEWSLQARADVMRTQLMADAVLLMALSDVLNTDDTNLKSASRHSMGEKDQTHVFFPKNKDELLVLRKRLGADECREGLCAPAQPLSTRTSEWQSRLNGSMATALNNAVYSMVNVHYWIEIFPAQTQRTSEAFVYRITVRMPRLKSANPIYLQAIWSNHIHEAGQWVSWTRLYD
jgi:hypothetical protein